MLALPPLVAETIFNIGPLPITNTYINSTLVLILFLIVGFVLRKRSREIPDKIQNFAESILEFAMGYVDQVTHDRKKSLKFLPIVGSLFFFILISNWLGIFPGIGSIGRWLSVHGEAELVPIFRPANTDLNTTLAMAVLGVAISHVFGIIAIGFWKYANKFVKLGDIHVITETTPHDTARGGSSTACLCNETLDKRSESFCLHLGCLDAAFLDKRLRQRTHQRAALILLASEFFDSVAMAHIR